MFWKSATRDEVGLLEYIIIPPAGYITKSHFDGVFQDLCEFVRHCNKRHIFLCLFVLFGHYYCQK